MWHICKYASANESRQRAKQSTRGQLVSSETGMCGRRGICFQSARDSPLFRSNLLVFIYTANYSQLLQTQQLSFNPPVPRASFRSQPGQKWSSVTGAMMARSLKTLRQSHSFKQFNSAPPGEGGKCDCWRAREDGR